MPRKLWKKGQSGNPNKTNVNKGLSRNLRMTRAEIAEQFSQLMELPETELKALSAAKDTPSKLKFVAQILLIGIRKGDPVRLNFLLDRVIGKVIDKTEVAIKPYVIERLDGAPLEVGAEPDDHKEMISCAVMDDCRRVEAGET